MGVLGERWSLSDGLSCRFLYSGNYDSGDSQNALPELVL
jgi:hypothetical protein